MSRIASHVRRVRNAHRYGLRFIRRGTFETPRLLQVGAKRIRLSFPDEGGIKNDFLTCLLDDEYGIWQTSGEILTVADLGANVGFFSIAARSRLPAARIHAYEPNPRTASFLTLNCASLGIEVFPEAVGGMRGFVNMEDAGDTNQARTRPQSGEAMGIAQVSLSDVVERMGGSVGLVKMDCEGAEWQMFEDRDAWRNIGELRMEYHLWGKYVFADVQRALELVNFEIFVHYPAPQWGTVWARNRGSNSATRISEPPMSFRNKK